MSPSNGAVLAIWLLLALLMQIDQCALAASHSRPLPAVTRVTKDASSSLYLISPRNYDVAPLVLDLAGPLIWWSCGYTDHHTVPCSTGLCTVANRNHPTNCPYAAAGGRPGSAEPGCNCTAYPSSPLDGQCGAGDLTWEWLSANATDGERPLYPVSFRAVAACAPDNVLKSLPFISPPSRPWDGRYPGVAGLSRSPLSLPAQAAAELKVASKFTLCLPYVTIFGGGRVRLMGSADDELGPVSGRLSRTRLLRNPKNAAYYIDVTGIAVNGARVPLPDRALALDAGEGRGGVALSTVTPYTALRPDVYRAVLGAFGAATAGVPCADAPAAPFELCYNMTKMDPYSWFGNQMATVDLMLADGKNWTFSGYGAAEEVRPQTVCFAFVEMGSAEASAVPDSPAVIIGGVSPGA
ncbi:hypothetical protein ACP4OV_029700 [Aristida adscensionis]